MRGDWLFRRLARRLIPQAVILLYHRVAETDYDPQLLCVSPKHFADHMEILRTAYRPLSLMGLSARKSLNLWQSRTVVVTFDDGYADNLYNAKPILQRYEIPSTVFVSSGFIGNERMPYWDELAYIFLQTPSLPPQLTLAVYGEMKTWEFNNEPPVDVRWNLLQQSRTGRQCAYKDICDYLRSLPPDSREGLLTEIRNWSGEVETAAATNQFMTVNELRSLIDDGLTEIGAHTMTHPNLASLPSHEQRREIVGGKRQLEEMTGQRVFSFAYPYGSRDNYTRETIHILKEEGFNCACSNFSGTIWFGSNRYQFPRLLVRNWSKDEFVKNLNNHFNAD